MQDYITSRTPSTQHI